MQKHFVATVYIFHEEKTLLLFHKKLGKWLPPGGHVEPDELPTTCAIREAFEETGLTIELTTEEHLWINAPNAVSFERPYMCLLENIPAYKDVPAHQHMDLIYLGKPTGTTLPQTEEGHKLHWFTLEEIRDLTSNEIFPDTLKVLETLLTTTPHANC